MNGTIDAPLAHVVGQLPAGDAVEPVAADLVAAPTDPKTEQPVAGPAATPSRPSAAAGGGVPASAVRAADDAVSRAAPSVKESDPPPQNGQKQKEGHQQKRDSTPAPSIAVQDSASIQPQDGHPRPHPHPSPPDPSATMGEAAKEDKAPAASPEASAKPVVDDAVKKTPVEGDEKATVAEEETAAPPADDKAEDDDAPPAADAAAETETATPSKPAKTPVSLARRKSVGPKLNRKGSKARITHLDAQPGDHYFVKLKGYPAWPVVICDEDMLPQTLLKARPVTAARPDGTYREDYADGGKRAADRTFPVMYLATNEFGWVPNQDLHDLDPSKVVGAINDKMRKDLQSAHRIAAEHNPLNYFKDLLRQFQEEIELEEERQREAEAKRLSTPKKPAAKKSKSEDIDMLDVPEDDDELVPKKSASSKKRKAEDDARTPQRTDSVKKPKIKITSSGTPKSNGTPSSAGKAKALDGKTKAKAESKAKEPVALPAERKPEPEPTPEEKRRRKTKEVLYLRHKIQKGLLPRDEEPNADEMEDVSDYLTKLEGFPDLEVGVIRETKINKVLKAILKIVAIPREEEFKFKPRSQTLLDKWNKLLAAEPAAAAPTNGEAKEGANGAKDKAEAKAPAAAEAKSNGVKADEEKKADKADEADEADEADNKADEKKAEEPAAVEAEA